MSEQPDMDKFDDVDQPAWDVIDILEPSQLKDVPEPTLDRLCRHRQKMKTIEAVKKIVLALIASLPAILAMIKGLLA